ncbi:MAG: DUF924 family protein [Pseudorhodoplanes sp.]|jgi:uncharacterized protein (DUF924 family)|nr:DUF924 family protein [Pseudorhodoplanes sp.]
MLRLFNKDAGTDAATRESFAELNSFDAGGGLRQRAQRTPLLSLSEAAAVIRFWIEAGREEWFGQRPEFDQRFRERFLSLHERVARADTASPDSADESLALLLLLDQFPRNAFRGTPRMYATDALACRIADAALRAGHDQNFETDLRPFFYLPFAHSEILADQERSVALAASLPEPVPSHARRHRDIIRRFGRFPHRNPILGRAMRSEEQQFLDEGGFAG